MVYNLPFFLSSLEFSDHRCDDLPPAASDPGVLRSGLGRLYSDSGLAVERGAVANVSPEKDREVNGDYASGGWKSSDASWQCGYASFKGKRPSMEDNYDHKSVEIDGRLISLFGIFDGHGGSRASEYLKEHLFNNLTKHPLLMVDPKVAISTNNHVKLLIHFVVLYRQCSVQSLSICSAFYSKFAGETFKRTDSDFLASESNTTRDDGSTASTAVLIGKQLFVANVGDSRAVICKAGKAIPLSDDHKPNRSDERKRIEDAGGIVMWAGTWRVGGILAMSRAFGNRLLKQFVLAEPEIQEQLVDEELEFLVLASDGLWDVVPNEDAVSLVRMEGEPEAAARKLTETAFARGSSDNITCIVVRFLHCRMEVTPLSVTQDQCVPCGGSQDGC